MNDQNRVLLRRGARALSEQEVEHVTGGIRTATLCTAPIGLTLARTEIPSTASAAALINSSCRCEDFS